jgi:sulfate/thiosulfate-binding protein
MDATVRDEVRAMTKSARSGFPRVAASLAVLLLLEAGIGGCRRREESGEGKPSGASTAARGKVTLILAGYTTPREAYGKAIIPAFQKSWKAKTGGDMEFQASYQGSGAQARAIVGGFEADIAALSLEADIEKVAQEKLIRHAWKSRPHGGMVTSSVVVLAVRKGNPKNIRDWADLTRPGVNVLTPDPKTSGGAMWNINAIYCAALRGYAGAPKGDKAAAERFLASVFRNVSIMDKGARESITTFEKGVGDVAITYENEVLVGQQAGQTYEYVVPRSTILIQNPVALVDASVDKHGVRDAAQAFVDFLWTPEAQRAYTRFGLRPVDPEVAREVETKFPRVEDVWTIDDLGGWKKVLEEIYGPQGVWSRVFAEKSKAR